MNCSKCNKIPNLFFEKSNVFIELPTERHTELFEKTLKEKTYTYQDLPTGYLIREVAFEEFVIYLKSNVFNSVEQKDVKILPLNNEEIINFSSLKHYRSLHNWMALYEGREVVSIIESGSIQTFFQPIIHAKTGKLYGYETLSRGICPDGSLMNPKQLFEQAKAMDLLFFLDRICRETSIRSAAKYKIKEKIFVNFIPTAIYEPELCLQSTMKVLSEENIQPQQVVFEVVESEKVIDFNHLNHILNYYKNKGVSTALDDLGSGYSDLNALIELKPNYMKIDRSIIHNIHLDEQKQRTLEEYLCQAKKIKAVVLAEGIETIEEYTYLKNKEIDLMQGFLFGKPTAIPKEKFTFSV